MMSTTRISFHEIWVRLIFSRNNVGLNRISCAERPVVCHKLCGNRLGCSQAADHSRARIQRVVGRDDRSASHLASDAWLSPDGLPASRPATLMSSSSASQWMPKPRPIRCQRVRSADDACDNRGYHASGTEMLRPSLKSTESVSSDTATFCANGTSNSTAEVRIPCLHQFASVIDHQRFNPCNRDARKTTTAV